MPRLYFLLALLGLAPTATLAGQVIPPPDSATLLSAAARSSLSYWVATSASSDQQSVYLRNNSTRAILIPSYEVYECINIPHKACGQHTPGPVVPPGKTITLVTISRLRDRDAWSYRYRYTAEFVPDTTGVPASP